jgi:hypothetical protein
MIMSFFQRRLMASILLIMQIGFDTVANGARYTGAVHTVHNPAYFFVRCSSCEMTEKRRPHERFIKPIAKNFSHQSKKLRIYFNSKDGSETKFDSKVNFTFIWLSTK